MDQICGINLMVCGLNRAKFSPQKTAVNLTKGKNEALDDKF